MLIYQLFMDPDGFISWLIAYSNDCCHLIFAHFMEWMSMRPLGLCPDVLALLVLDKSDGNCSQ